MLTKLLHSISYKCRQMISIRETRTSIKRANGLLRGKVRLTIHGDFKFGDHLILNGIGIDYPPLSIYVGPGARLQLGNDVGISQTSIYCKQHIEIGDYVKIGAGCLIFDSNFHDTDWRIRSDRTKDTGSAINAPVKIGNHAFIGARCIISKGVTIGEKSIVAAGSVVIEDILANCFGGGNAINIKKFLDSEEIR